MKRIIEKDSDDFGHKTLTLKVRNWHFLIVFYEKVLFHSIKLLFDAEVAEKFIHGIYSLSSMLINTAGSKPRNFLITLSNVHIFCFLPRLEADFLLEFLSKIQSNLVIRNFLVTLKLFLNVKCSLSQAFNQSTI